MSINRTQTTIRQIYVIWYQWVTDNYQTNSCNVRINGTQTTIRLIHVIWVTIGQTNIRLIHVIWVLMGNRQLSDKFI